MRSVTVVYHCEDGTFWADSPDRGLATFVAGGRSFEETRRLAADGLRFHLGEQVCLTEIFEDGVLVDLYGLPGSVAVEDSAFAAPITFTTTRPATLSLRLASPRPLLIPVGAADRGAA
jgi:hypothetical protein